MQIKVTQTALNMESEADITTQDLLVYYYNMPTLKRDGLSQQFIPLERQINSKEELFTVDIFATNTTQTLWLRSPLFFDYLWRIVYKEYTHVKTN